MTNIIEGIQELRLPLLIKVSADAEDTSKEFNMSVDELGRILLTPYAKEAQFDLVELDDEQKIITDPSVRRIVLFTTVDCPSDNRSMIAEIDEIGDCVIRFEDPKNKFLALIVSDSLDIITEAFAVETYANYTLMNTGDGWDVKAPNGDIIEEGIATLSKAKIFILKTELARLQQLQDAENNSVEEDVNPLHESLCEVTCNFEDSNGTIECDSYEDCRYCSKVLASKYHNITESYSEKCYLIEYSDRKKENELTASEKQEVISKFLSGKLPIQMSEGEPLDTYIHLEDLDSGKYVYFYDPESGSIPVYFREEIEF